MYGHICVVHVLHDIEDAHAYLLMHKYGKYVNWGTQQQNLLLMHSMYTQWVIKIILCQKSSWFDGTTAFFSASSRTN